MRKGLLLTACLAVAACVPRASLPEPTAVPASETSVLAPIASPAPPATATASPLATAAPTLTETPAATTTLPEQTPLPPVEQARADLAASLGVPPEAIEVVAVLPASSPDVSLGCARYALSDNPPPPDALVIELRYQDQVYTYQSAGVDRPVQCGSGVGYPPATRDRRDNILTPPAQP